MVEECFVCCEPGGHKPLQLQHRRARHVPTTNDGDGALTQRGMSRLQAEIPLCDCEAKAEVQATSFFLCVRGIVWCVVPKY